MSAEPKQWIATDQTGTELLVTLHDGDYLEVAPRVDGTRWGVPYAVVAQ